MALAVQALQCAAIGFGQAAHLLAEAARGGGDLRVRAGEQLRIEQPVLVLQMGDERRRQLVPQGEQVQRRRRLAIARSARPAGAPWPSAENARRAAWGCWPWSLLGDFRGEDRNQPTMTQILRSISIMARSPGRRLPALAGNDAGSQRPIRRAARRERQARRQGGTQTEMGAGIAASPHCAEHGYVGVRLPDPPKLHRLSILTHQLRRRFPPQRLVRASLSRASLPEGSSTWVRSCLVRRRSNSDVPRPFLG